MKWRRRNIVFLLMLLIFILYLKCDFDPLVQNHDALTKEDLFSVTENAESYLGHAFKYFWHSQTNFYSLAFGVSCLADEMTTSWGTAGSKDLSEEPRKAWDNHSSYQYSFVTERAWEDAYKALSVVNDVLQKIEKGKKFIDKAGNDHTQMNEAFARFIQGICLGWLGLVFDQAVILEENTNPEKAKPAPYFQVINEAINKLTECIRLCESSTFTIPESWWPGNYFTQEELLRLANSFIARILTSESRSPEERAAADWQAIRTHAERGITVDFGVYCDKENWFSDLHGIGSNSTFFRTDYKLLGPADTSGNYQTWLSTPVKDRDYIYIYTDDKRVTGNSPTEDGSYFAYYGNCYFRPNRGTYHFSYYHIKRFYDYYRGGFIGYVPILTVTELNLIRAEAELRLGNPQIAANLINLTRVVNGGLAPADIAVIGKPGDLRYVHGSLWAMLKYEKGIETCQTQCGVAWFDRRGWGTLPRGSILHFPIPGAQLKLMGISYYTFGGNGQGAAPE